MIPERHGRIACHWRLLIVPVPIYIRDGKLEQDGVPTLCRMTPDKGNERRRTAGAYADAQALIATLGRTRNGPLAPILSRASISIAPAQLQVISLLLDSCRPPCRSASRTWRGRRNGIHFPK